MKKYLLSKISNRSKNILKETLDLCKNYSPLFASITFLWWISYYGRFTKLEKSLWQKKQKLINKYLNKNYSSIIKEYRDKSESKNYTDKFKIWVFWAQGEDKMPNLVKGCLNNLRKIESENLIFLTLENVKNYIELPEIIWERLNKNQISLTNFSDILRFSLLAKHGGVWYDATCWISRKYPPQFENLTFFSPHHKFSHTDWVSYCFGSGLIESVTISFVRDILWEVCKKEKVWPDYQFIAYVLNFAINNLEASKNLLNSIPENNTNRALLFPLMNKPYNLREYENLTLNNNWIFKLSYKAHYEDYKDGKPTFYHKLINPD